MHTFLYGDDVRRCWQRSASFLPLPSLGALAAFMDCGKSFEYNVKVRPLVTKLLKSQLRYRYNPNDTIPKFIIEAFSRKKQYAIPNNVVMNKSVINDEE